MPPNKLITTMSCEQEPHSPVTDRSKSKGSSLSPQEYELRNVSSSAEREELVGSLHEDGVRRVLTEEAGYQYLPFCWPTWKKWAILTSIFIVQLSMNFNAAIYANSVSGMMKTFNIKHKTAKYGQMVFLVAYAFGCELWAPWSEELGRKWVLQGSLFMVNIWQIPCALAPSYSVVFAFRFLGGLSSAGGSVTLGMVADMWEPVDQQYAVAYVVLSSVAGSVIAPIFGGFIEVYLGWRWVSNRGYNPYLRHRWLTSSGLAGLLDLINLRRCCTSHSLLRARNPRHLHPRQASQAHAEAGRERRKHLGSG